MDKYVIIMTHLANITYQKTSNRTLSSIIVVPRHGEPLPRYTSFLQLLCKKPFYPFPHSGNLLSVYASAFTLIWAVCHSYTLPFLSSVYGLPSPLINKQLQILRLIMQLFSLSFQELKKNIDITV